MTQERTPELIINSAIDTIKSSILSIEATYKTSPSESYKNITKIINSSINLIQIFHFMLYVQEVYNKTRDLSKEEQNSNNTNTD